MTRDFRGKAPFPQSVSNSRNLHSAEVAFGKSVPNVIICVQAVIIEQHEVTNACACEVQCDLPTSTPRTGYRYASFAKRLR